MLSFGPISSLFDIVTFLFLYYFLCPALCGGATYLQLTDPSLKLQYAASVSYTHLDVYKRQAFNSVYAIKNQAYCANSPIFAGIAKIATKVTAQPI